MKTLHKTPHDYSILFKKLEDTNKELALIEKDELREMNEIRELREIILELETPAQVYFSTSS